MVGARGQVGDHPRHDRRPHPGPAGRDRHRQAADDDRRDRLRQGRPDLGLVTGLDADPVAAALDLAEQLRAARPTSSPRPSGSSTPPGAPAPGVRSRGSGSSRPGCWPPATPRSPARRRSGRSLRSSAPGADEVPAHRGAARRRPPVPRARPLGAPRRPRRPPRPGGARLAPPHVAGDRHRGGRRARARRSRGRGPGRLAPGPARPGRLGHAGVRREAGGRAPDPHVGPAAPGAGAERHELDARRRVGVRHLPVERAPRGVTRDRHRVVRPRGLRQPRRRLPRPAGGALRRPARAEAARHRPRQHATAGDQGAPGPSRRIEAVGARLRRRPLLPRRRRPGRGCHRRPARAGGRDRRRRGGSRPDHPGQLRPLEAGPGRRLPDRAGARLGGPVWWVTQRGRVGTVGPSGDAEVLDLGEEVANSMAADQDGVYVVTTYALYRCGRRRAAVPR